MEEQANLLLQHACSLIKDALKVSLDEIGNISILKRGMTNHSFLFTCKEKRYIMRVPGEGTERLINRKQEYEVYQKIAPLNICDPVVYMDPENGYKITEYLENARVCDAGDRKDVSICMQKLRSFHELKLQVSHSFDIFKQIDFYESLWERESQFEDYALTKSNVFELREYIGRQEKQWVLAHIDAVPDNFLFVPGEETEGLRLIDWEYAGMQDACVDIAMFAIYAMYGREEIEYLIDAYYTEGCTRQTRLKIYCYIASCGLLWSNWCEYKHQFGIGFGEYSLQRYQYAKEYYEVFRTERGNYGQQ